jgi:hypothetical protein
MRRAAMALPLAAFVLLMACGGDEPARPIANLPTTVLQTTTVTATTTAPVTAPATTRATTAASAPATAPPTAPATTTRAPAAVSYANCAAVRAAGAAPIRRGEPGYSTSLDRDGDGVACET